MALANLGFETAGATPGAAASWTLTVVATAYEIAGYLYDATANELAIESFEGRWDGNQDFLFEFDDPPTQLSAASYDTLLGTPKLVEDFEEKWDSNEDYVYSILGATASYDTAPQNFEDFEHEWNANESYIYALAGTTAASYDTAPEAFEDFEENWDGNEAFVYALGPVAVAIYHVGAPVAFENFEIEWDLMTTV